MKASPLQWYFEGMRMPLRSPAQNGGMESTALAPRSAGELFECGPLLQSYDSYIVMNSSVPLDKGEHLKCASFS